jgi:hypothetical protein
MKMIKTIFFKEMKVKILINTIKCLKIKQKLF